MIEDGEGRRDGAGRGREGGRERWTAGAILMTHAHATLPKVISDNLSQSIFANILYIIFANSWPDSQL